MKKQLYNKPELKQYRRTLRSNLTPAEATLWRFLKNKQLDGRRFRRQYSVGGFILDFYCPKEKLAVELDGEPHFDPAGMKYDQERGAYLKRKGIKVIRFENQIVFDNTEVVLREIESYFKNPLPPT